MRRDPKSFLWDIQEAALKITLDVRTHPNRERYPSQMVYYVKINDYVYVVPFVVRGDGSAFLKTIIPSRKATREYLGR